MPFFLGGELLLSGIDIYLVPPLCFGFGGARIPPKLHTYTHTRELDDERQQGAETLPPLSACLMMHGL